MIRSHLDAVLGECARARAPETPTASGLSAWGVGARRRSGSGRRRPGAGTASLRCDCVWLELLEEIVEEDALRDYHLLYAVRGDLLARLGRNMEAAASFIPAAQLTANIAEQRFLRDRANAGPVRRSDRQRRLPAR